jgi:hypothetical protein
VRVASTPEERAWFDAQLEKYHDLGASPSAGDFLRQIVEIDSRPVALAAWGPACDALKDRDRWMILPWGASFLVLMGLSSLQTELVSNA